MNNYQLSRAWFDFAFKNPHKIKPIHGIIFFFAVEHCNRLGWKSIFGFPTSMVLEATGIKSYSSYKKHFDELVSFGFIKVHEYSKNQYSSNIIELSLNVKAIGKALDKALVTHSSKQHESTGQSNCTIDKQYTNKQINNNIKTLKVFEQEILDCYDSCINYFPDDLVPKGQKEIDNWLDAIEKLNRLDNWKFEDITAIVAKTREDTFWQKNFLSMAKLRTKDKEGLQYINVFYNKFRIDLNSKNNENKRQYITELTKRYPNI